MTDQPQPLGAVAELVGVVHGYADIHAILRARAEQLNISRVDLDRLTHLAPGYCGKLLAPTPIRKPSDETLHFLLPALGLKMVLMTDPQSVERIRQTTQPRDASRAVHAAVTHYSLSHRFLRRIGRLGGKARAKSLTPAQRSRLARKAAKARWARRGSSE